MPKKKKKTRVDTDVTLVFLKRFSDPVVSWLVKTPVTPNQVTLGSFLIFAPLTAYLLFKGGYLYNFLALGVLFLHSFLDLMDGEMVRQGKPSSKLGIWFEFSLDPLMQQIVIYSIALHTLVVLPMGLNLLALLPLFGQGWANSLGLLLSVKFKIDPLTGQKEFNDLVGGSKYYLDFVLKNIIVPSHWLFVMLFTLRFYLVVGIFLNILPYAFIVFGFFIVLRALVVYLVLTIRHGDNPKKYDKYAVFRYLNEVG